MVQVVDHVVGCNFNKGVQTAYHSELVGVVVILESAIVGACKQFSYWVRKGVVDDAGDERCDHWCIRMEDLFPNFGGDTCCTGGF